MTLVTLHSSRTPAFNFFRFASLSLLFAVLAGCGRQAAQTDYTAERVKRVEERQKADANFYAERNVGKAPAGAAVQAKPDALAAEQPASAAKVR